MPNLDSTGKFGRSMDCSQLLEIKRKYKQVQEQNSKPVPGSQQIKPIFNSNKTIGGGTDNGASAYYHEGGLSLLFKRRTLF